MDYHFYKSSFFERYNKIMVKLLYHRQLLLLPREYAAVKFYDIETLLGELCGSCFAATTAAAIDGDSLILGQHLRGFCGKILLQSVDVVLRLWNMTFCPFVGTPDINDNDIFILDERGKLIDADRFELWL